MISIRSLRDGRSTNQIASNLPARRNSGGNSVMLFAVATIKADFCSLAHVKKCENIPIVVPESLSPPLFVPENIFSSSSRKRTQFPKASIILVASRIRRSDSPTRAFFKAPMSRRMSGNWSIEAMEQAVLLFPVPGTPTSKIPLGFGKLELGWYALDRLMTYSLSGDRPPTSAISAAG